MIGATHPTCRQCGAPLEMTLVDLGLSPLANSYVDPAKADIPDSVYPLHARVCTSCWLVQVDDVVPAEEIFSTDYAYFSSFSDSWLAHCRDYVDSMTQRFDLGSGDLVIEIASNDGYLLQYFVEKGIPVLGIEPSGNVAAAAEKKGVRTLVDYFGETLAQKVAKTEQPPALIASANVLAHVPEINDFVTGIATLLKEDAVYTVEFPHLLNLINSVQFDTIYHEHYSYLSLLAVEEIFAKAGLRVFDVEELPTHGGSLRVYACLEAASHPEGAGVAKVRAREAAAQFDRPEGYMNFTGQVETLRDGLLTFLRGAQAKGETVAAYGAAAKGNTLLNYAGIGPDLISYCVDRNPAKQNTLLPGSRIPVHGVEALRETSPDYVLILPWNIRDEVIDQLADLRAQGTRFVTAVPEVRIS
ncbi:MULTISPECIES: class I SAM-dependent methyltransferase [unclassified Ruegeria]|uniref:class I SAM-dependent methyltransferase n=1 Tax=unclassified Ruegeria TaxID=2625375 RepID=UPI001491FA5D|nr:MULTISPECIES: class I SAM-dependent methyltransferase [unclassified Ruegeria]NOD36558.1 methyltransferase domain-containing protein [Ruegeria sp. HKCCD7296]NOE43798.1 methyltransferase domain-containing protein [Ruegeria sp. HKCCD7319]